MPSTSPLISPVTSRSSPPEPASTDSPSSLASPAPRGGYSVSCPFSSSTVVSRRTHHSGMPFSSASVRISRRRGAVLLHVRQGDGGHRQPLQQLGHAVGVVVVEVGEHQQIQPVPPQPLKAVRCRVPGVVRSVPAAVHQGVVVPSRIRTLCPCPTSSTAAVISPRLKAPGVEQQAGAQRSQTGTDRGLPSLLPRYSSPRSSRT